MIGNSLIFIIFFLLNDISYAKDVEPRNIKNVLRKAKITIYEVFKISNKNKFGFVIFCFLLLLKLLVIIGILSSLDLFAFSLNPRYTIGYNLNDVSIMPFFLGIVLLEMINTLTEIIEAKEKSDVQEKVINIFVTSIFVFSYLKYYKTNISDHIIIKQSTHILFQFPNIGLLPFFGVFIYFFKRLTNEIKENKRLNNEHKFVEHFVRKFFIVYAFFGLGSKIQFLNNLSDLWPSISTFLEIASIGLKLLILNFIINLSLILNKKDERNNFINYQILAIINCIIMVFSQ